MRLKKAAPITSLLLPLRSYCGVVPIQVPSPATNLRSGGQVPSTYSPLAKTIQRPPPGIFLPKQLSFALPVVSFVATA